MKHKHEFTALWTHFGPYGDQGIHYHVCFADGCDRVLIGQGRECGSRESHRRATLAAASGSAGNTDRGEAA